MKRNSKICVTAVEVNKTKLRVQNIGHDFREEYITSYAICDVSLFMAKLIPKITINSVGGLTPESVRQKQRRGNTNISLDSGRAGPHRESSRHNGFGFQTVDKSNHTKP